MVSTGWKTPISQIPAAAEPRTLAAPLCFLSVVEGGDIGEDLEEIDLEEVNGTKFFSHTAGRWDGYHNRKDKVSLWCQKRVREFKGWNLLE